VIISGYDSFDYARQAIDLGVIGYLTKPISFDEMKQTLLKTKEELDKQDHIDKDIKELEKQASTALKLFQDNDLCRLISLKSVSLNFKKKLVSNGINLNLRYSQLATFDFDCDEDSLEYDSIEFALIYLEKYLAEEFSLDQGIDLVFFNHSTQKNLLFLSDFLLDQSLLKEKLARTLLKIKKNLGVSLYAGLSEVKENKDDSVSYRKLYRHSNRALEYRTIFGTNLVILYTEIEPGHPSTCKVDDHDYKEISYELSYGRIDLCKQKVGVILDRMTLASFKDTYFFTLTSLVDCILKSCVNLDALYTQEQMHIDIMREVYSIKTHDALYEYLSNLVDKVNNINNQNRISGVESTYNQITDYIKSNYVSPNLSLEEVSNKLSYSISYISAVLKKYGTLFTKYLTDIRMEKAKELVANPSYRILEISKMVGYEDPYYFSHCFKKYYGLSPLEYRKK